MSASHYIIRRWTKRATYQCDLLRANGYRESFSFIHEICVYITFHAVNERERQRKAYESTLRK
jgi:hypothetical protein